MWSDGAIDVVLCWSSKHNCSVYDENVCFNSCVHSASFTFMPPIMNGIRGRPAVAE